MQPLSRPATPVPKSPVPHQLRLASAATFFSRSVETTAVTSEHHAAHGGRGSLADSATGFVDNLLHNLFTGVNENNKSTDTINSMNKTVTPTHKPTQRQSASASASPCAVAAQVPKRRQQQHATLFDQITSRSQSVDITQAQESVDASEQKRSLMQRMFRKRRARSQENTQRPTNASRKISMLRSIFSNRSNSGVVAAEAPLRRRLAASLVSLLRTGHLPPPPPPPPARRASEFVARYFSSMPNLTGGAARAKPTAANASKSPLTAAGQLNLGKAARVLGIL